MSNKSKEVFYRKLLKKQFNNNDVNNFTNENIKKKTILLKNYRDYIINDFTSLSNYIRSLLLVLINNNTDKNTEKMYAYFIYFLVYMIEYLNKEKDIEITYDQFLNIEAKKEEILLSLGLTDDINNMYNSTKQLTFASTNLAKRPFRLNKELQ